MDWVESIIELLKFEIVHDEIILTWAIIDKEQNLTIEYSKN